MGYKIARFLVNLIVVLGCRMRIVGKNHIPPEGGLVIAANHVGRLDAIFIYHVTNRKDIILLVAEKYRQIPLARWFVKQLNAIWVDRFNADFSALREALNRLKRGGVMVLAPEGTRSASGVLQKARPGVSYLAAKSGAPIVPVGLVGSQDYNVVAHLRRLKRPLVTIYVGEPFTLPPVKGKERDAALEEYTDEIMCRIAALLPPEMRGVYADYPRLKELLEHASREPEPEVQVVQ
jgi:1-acyl-sn-glycerol-3-phosphate acyltransferase